MRQNINFTPTWKLSILSHKNMFILSLCLLFSNCATHYKSYYVAPTYFFTLPQSKQRVSKNLIVIHGPEKSYYLLKPSMNDSTISGIPEVILDTAGIVYKQTLEFAESGQSSPIFLYTNKPDTSIQQEIKLDTSKRLQLKVSDLHSVKFKPNQSYATTYSSSPKKQSSQTSTMDGIVFTLLGLVVVVMVSVITFIMLARSGCYIATMVYKSYEAPEVLVLRKFRDEQLLPFWWGKAIVVIYYSFSPLFVKLFRNNSSVNALCKNYLDQLINQLEYKPRKFPSGL